MAASILLLLTSVGLFLSAQAQDCPRPVGGPNMGLKGDDILLETFPDGKKVTFACDVGYESVGGSASIICTAGNWSSLRMKCERRSCGPIGDVTNGEVDYSGGIQFGDKLTVTCNPGYTLIGNPTIRCGNEGWMGRLPVCEVTQCDPPAAPTIGSFYPVKETYEYSEVIQFSCPEPYTLNGSKSLSCSKNGVFQPATPKCVKVDCKEPVVEFGHWDSGSRAPYTYKATVTFKCNEGYRMKNSATIICGINDLWEPELPVCELVPEVKTTTTKSPESTKKPTVVTEVKTTTTKRPESTKKTTAAPGPTAPGPT
ncbi:Membrane cofactor protein, partial [Dissostichus eleginoides]